MPDNKKSIKLDHGEIGFKVVPQGINIPSKEADKQALRERIEAMRDDDDTPDDIKAILNESVTEKVTVTIKKSELKKLDDDALEALGIEIVRGYEEFFTAAGGGLLKDLEGLILSLGGKIDDAD